MARKTTSKKPKKTSNVKRKPKPVKPSKKPKASSKSSSKNSRATTKTEGITKDGKKFPIPKLGESLKLPPCPTLPPEPKPKPQTVEDKKLIESMLYMKTNKFMQKSKSTIKFDTVKEAEDIAKEDIVAAIIDKTNLLKQDKSDLQKKGNNLSLQGLKLLQIPLKTKIWKSSIVKKDLESIYKIFTEVESVIIPMKGLQIKIDEEHEKNLNRKEIELTQEKQAAEEANEKLLEPLPTKSTPKAKMKSPTTKPKPTKITPKKPTSPKKPKK
ncbi:hypothetical protein KAS08_04380 [Candidatus Pacearchaeota archaeon]|nr:hypothetical protein [Candidatus Pacearchaeota archaeon]